MSRRKHGFPETTGVETRMGTASHNQRLKRLEASRGISEREPLFFDLREWEPDCPLTFDSEAEREASIQALKPQHSTTSSLRARSVSVIGTA
jgi:hypothetical protein